MYIQFTDKKSALEQIKELIGRARNLEAHTKQGHSLEHQPDSILEMRRICSDLLSDLEQVCRGNKTLKVGNLRLVMVGKLKQGTEFYKPGDPEGRVRYLSQIGKTEVYCPYIGQNTMGHSMSSGDEVFIKSMMVYVSEDVALEQQIN